MSSPRPRIRGQELQLGDLHLDLGAPTASVTQEHVEDDGFAIADRDARDVFEVTGLRRRELGVEHQHGRAARAGSLTDGLCSARAQQSARVGARQLIQLVPGDTPTLMLHQRHDLGELRRTRDRILIGTDRDHVAGAVVGHRGGTRRFTSIEVLDLCLELPGVGQRHLRMLGNRLGIELEHALVPSRNIDSQRRHTFALA
jgi:hypothetical protein